jgi:tetratricopeptide (TPR) repeat protein
MIDKEHSYNIIVDILISVSIIFVLCTVFSINRDLGNGTVSGKYFWFYASMALLSVVAIPSAIIKRKNRLDLKFADLLMLLFCGAAFVITLIHTGRLTTKCFLLILLLFFYFYLRIFLSNRSNLIRYLIIVCLIFTGLVEVVWGLRQLYGLADSHHNLFKTTGSFFNPGPYSGWLAMIFPIAFWYAVPWFIKKNIPEEKFALNFSYICSFLKKWIPIITGFLMILCTISILPAAMSRASWLAALGGTVFIGIMYFIFPDSAIQGKRIVAISDYIKKHKIKVIILSFMTVILLAVSLMGLFLLKKDSAWGRVFTWKIAAQTIQENPFGVGLGNFGGSYGNAQAAYFASGAGTENEEHVAEGVEYAFNEYLQICIETGIIPLFIFLAFVFYVLYMGVKNKNYIPAGSLVSLLIFASMSYPFNVLPFVIAFVCLSVLCITDNEDRKTKPKNLYPKFAIWFFIIAVPVTIVLCGYKLYSSYEAYKQWKKTKVLYGKKLYEKASEEYEKQYPYIQDDIKFLFEYAGSLSRSGEYKKSNEILHRTVSISCDPVHYNMMGINYQLLKEYELAEQSFRKAANLVPNRILPHYLLAKLYYEMGLKDKAEVEINIVMTKPPKVESMAVEEMREELKTIFNVLNDER